MKSKKYKNIKELANDFGVESCLAEISLLKAKLTKEIIEAIEDKELTHLEVSKISGVPRSSVTGIVSGSLQRVSIDRLVRILSSLGKSISIKVKNVA